MEFTTQQQPLISENPSMPTPVPQLVADSLRGYAKGMGTLRISRTIVLDDAELEERFIHASGPGGQNVNKVATAVQIRFDVAGSPSLPEEVRRRLLAAGGQRLTQDGVLILTARRYRTQDRNRADARERLAALIREAATPERSRRPTKPTLASKKRRLAAKAARSTLKRGRTRPVDE